MNVLVTGGLGFIGSTLVDFLVKKNNNVYVIDNLLTGSLLNKNLKVCKLIHEDLSSPSYINLLKNLIDKNSIHTVYHLAALPSVQQSIDYTTLTHRHNLTATVNILEGIKNTNAKKIIFSSTSAVYGDCNMNCIDENSNISPMTPYALQKLMSEQYIEMYCKLHNISAVCLRYFNVFGERMTNVGAYKSVISIFNEQKHKNVPLTITGDGEQRRDFISVADVVNANYLAANTHTGKFNIYNVGGGINYSINEIASIYNHPKNYIQSRIESRNSLCNNSKICKELNWNPTVDVKDWIKSKI